MRWACHLGCHLPLEKQFALWKTKTDDMPLAQPQFLNAFLLATGHGFFFFFFLLLRNSLPFLFAGARFGEANPRSGKKKKKPFKFKTKLFTFEKMNKTEEKNNLQGEGPKKTVEKTAKKPTRQKNKKIMNIRGGVLG